MAEDKAIEFESKASASPLLVEALSGAEAISRPFEFRLDLLSKDKSAKLEDFVRHKVIGERRRRPHVIEPASAVVPGGAIVRPTGPGIRAD